VNRPAKTTRLWTADSADRDFRDERWASRELDVQSGSIKALAEVDTPSQGYRAYMFEVVLISSTGLEYKLSTEARVTPDHIR
jgi:hypothetical protein